MTPFARRRNWQCYSKHKRLRKWPAFWRHPTAEQIVAFHPFPEVAERAYELIQTEREGSLSEEERQELGSYLMIEYLMELVKLEAHQQLRQQV